MIDQNTLAPIVLFVYNRPLHTQQTLEALAKNDFADQSVLYIYADGPKENATQEILQKIIETREVIRSSQWCKEVIIYEKEKNAGLADSIIAGVTEIVDKHGKIIVLEDDIITSEDFLLFMNEALNYYKNFEVVAGVSGFKYPSVSNLSKVHFLPIGCSWSWATWKREWVTIEFDAEKLLNTIEERQLATQLDFGGYQFYNMLKAQVEGKINSWAIRFYTSFFLNNKCFAYPPVSFVQNIGFDNSATHTMEKENFFDRVNAEGSRYKFVEPLLNEEVLNVKKAFENNFLKENSEGSIKSKNFFYYAKKISELFDVKQNISKI